jgi:hypothetical protein
MYTDGFFIKLLKTTERDRKLLTRMHKLLIAIDKKGLDEENKREINQILTELQ